MRSRLRSRTRSAGIALVEVLIARALLAETSDTLITEAGDRLILE